MTSVRSSEVGEGLGCNWSILRKRMLRSERFSEGKIRAEKYGKMADFEDSNCQAPSKSELRFIPRLEASLLEWESLVKGGADG